MNRESNESCRRRLKQRAGRVIKREGRAVFIGIAVIIGAVVFCLIVDGAIEKSFLDWRWLALSGH